jgi:hypothetical protein
MSLNIVFKILLVRALLANICKYSDCIKNTTFLGFFNQSACMLISTINNTIKYITKIHGKSTVHCPFAIKREVLSEVL